MSTSETEKATMIPSLINRVVTHLYTCGKRVYPRNFLKGMFQADVVSPSVAYRRAFRPRLEVLEDRLAPTVSFAAQATFAASSGPFATAVADFNSDGKPDMVVSNFLSSSIGVLLNTTTNGATAPTFSAQQTFSSFSEPTVIAVGDVNGDGRPDIAVASFNNGIVEVFLNTTPAGATAASFSSGQAFAIGTHPVEGIAFADLNADGRPDLIVANSGSGTVSVLMNTTAGNATAASFAAQQTFAAGSSPLGLAVGDLNDDGRPDFVVANSNSVTVSVLLNTTAAGATSASFAAAQTFLVGTFPSGVALADLNGDGRPDLAVANNGSATLGILLNTTTVGSTVVSFAAQQTFAVAHAFGIAVGDFSGDGRPDLAVGSNGSSTVAVFENTTAFNATTASFAAQQTLTTGANAQLPVAADFNFDGRVDLAIGNTGSAGTVSVLLNNLPTFQAAVTGPVVVGDFTGYGINLFNLTVNTYVQLSTFDPSALADNAEGWVVGNFPGYGVQLYRPGFSSFGNFTQLTPFNSTLLSIDALGDVVGNFPGYGVNLYRATTGWIQITPVQATQAAFDAYGNVYANFPGYGLQQYSLAGNSWKQITPFNPTTFAVNAYDQIVAVFAGYGTQKFTPWSGWLALTPFNSTSVAINSNGVVIATFPGYGVQQNSPGAANWTQTTPAAGQFLAIDRYGHGFGDFPGYGVNFYNPQSNWTNVVSKIDPALLAVADWPFDFSSPF